MSREKKQTFMGGVTVLAISTVFVKICGALYKSFIECCFNYIR